MLISAKSVEDCIPEEKRHNVQSVLQNINKFSAIQSLFTLIPKAVVLMNIALNFVGFFRTTYDNQIQIGVLKNIAKFSRKHLCWSFLLIKLQVSTCKFFKKTLQHRCFPVLRNFWKQFFYITLLDDRLSNTIQISLYKYVSGLSIFYISTEWVVSANFVLKLQIYCFFLHTKYQLY